MFLTAPPSHFVRPLLTAALLCSTFTRATSVNVALEASFRAPPFLLELLETAAQENGSCYFPLLDRVAEGAFIEYGTEKDLYEAFLETLQRDQYISDPEDLSSFKLALATRAAAPRIEAHYQYYNTSIQPLLPIAQDAACPVWVHHDGKQYCSPTLERAQQDYKGPSNNAGLPFDHVLTLSDELPVSTLYVDINSPLFGEFHQILSERARSGQASYRVRYRPSPNIMDRNLALTGYGVELALKRTDYIVIDDRDEDKTNEPEQEKQTNEEKVSFEEEELNDLKPLSSSELLGLGFKASSFIMNSADPLDTLERLSQDFPKHSSRISKFNYTTEFVSEHEVNRGLFLTSGVNVIWMNGLQVNVRQMDAFSLADKLRHERKIIRNLKATGFTAPEAISLVSHSALTRAHMSSGTARYDYRDEIEGGTTILWLNNIEKDKRYSDWPTHATGLLQPVFPGQLPTVRRDIHNAVFPFNLANIKDLEEAVETLQTLVQRRIPVRFGIVPTVDTAEAENQAKVVYYLQDKYGLGAVMSYLQASADDRSAPQFSESRFQKVLKGRELRRDRVPLPLSDIFGGSEFQDRVASTKRYLSRLGIRGPSPPYFVNGLAIPSNDDWLQTMSNRISMDIQALQQKVFEETIGDDFWMAGHFLEGATAQRNALIIPEDESLERVVDISDLATKHSDLIEALPQMPSEDSSLPQFWSHVIVVTDLETPEGLKLLNDVVEFRKAQIEANVLIIHNPKLSTALNFHSAKLFETISKGTELKPQDIIQILDESSDSGIEPGQIHEMAQTYWLRMQPLVNSFGLEPGDSGVILNGRCIGPIQADTGFNAEDFAQLLSYERTKRITPVNTALASLGLEDRLKSALAAAQLTSLVARAVIPNEPEGVFGNGPNFRVDSFMPWQSEHTAIVKGEKETASIQIVASIDPTSEVAQRWIPILKTLSELSGVYMKLYLNPREGLKEIPVKRFYRYVVGSKPTFNGDGSLQSPAATFAGLPREALLNLAMDVPPAWLVAPKHSIHDLDNIKLSALAPGTDVNAIYELEHILIEGHSRDATNGQVPRGAQLLLGTERDQHFADTLIMANLGYFQFKANPGFWNIRLKSGSSEDIFKIDNLGINGQDEVTEDGSTDVCLMSFQGLTVFPRLSRKAGQEAADVLGDRVKGGSAGGYVAKASKFASGFLSNVGLGTKSEHADINIFSVASGHLYERMLNIMMVSVMKHTQHTVKFWFIEQFLSPAFKETLPDLAAAYNFDFEMVTYKWPHWLRGQKEKQREIWGYKILFLDVLFPLSLDKVIFVDADQIVRTDMYDLVIHDLQGAPYGFTPMCDSRTEMEGFRFWKEGYWKKFLRGLPYHISALYVVDLKKFRQLAAGDRLRQQYQQLSADPNSLSNLDQDLPNNMQMQLPIHSLPQEWLWCETWCSDESLKDAKTIDLCNNPLTKEPKLDRARRQVPEWTVYDDEIAALFGRRTTIGASSAGARVQEELDSRSGGASSSGGGDSDGDDKDAGSKDGDGDSQQKRIKDEL